MKSTGFMQFDDKLASSRGKIHNLQQICGTFKFCFSGSIGNTAYYRKPLEFFYANIDYTFLFILV